jgi:hypothetical protein
MTRREVLRAEQATQLAKLREASVEVEAAVARGDRYAATVAVQDAQEAFERASQIYDELKGILTNQIERLKSQAWHEFGIAILRPEEIADQWLAQGLKDEAERRYGRRNGPAEKG